MSDYTIVFITGGNAGLGLEIVKSLCRSQKKYHIIIGTRKISNGESAIEQVKKLYPQTSNTFEVVQADLESDDALSKAVETINTNHGRIDALVNIGGANFDKKIQTGELTVPIPLLLKSSDPRLIFMTSGTCPLHETELFDNRVLQTINASPEKGWPKPPEFNPIAAYRSSKCRLNMLMREWCTSPGFLATGLAGMDADKLREMGAQEPSVGGDFVVSVIEGKRDQDVGKVIRASMIRPW